RGPGPWRPGRLRRHSRRRTRTTFLSAVAPRNRKKEPTLLPLPVLILIGLAGLGLLLLLIIRFKMQAFYALILVSIIVGLAAGLPMTTIPADGDAPERLGV